VDPAKADNVEGIGSGLDVSQESKAASNEVKNSSQLSGMTEDMVTREQTGKREGSGAEARTKKLSWAKCTAQMKRTVDSAQRNQLKQQKQLG
jgi:hypothetical protein